MRSTLNAAGELDWRHVLGVSACACCTTLVVIAAAVWAANNL
jgi:hypothetical protein